MRTIKFRCWDTVNKKMYSVDDLGGLWSIGIPVAVHQSMDDKHDIHLRIDENPLMQFTGLLDCKGCEIYENDIVQLSSNQEKPHHKGVVEYLAPKFFVIDGEKSGLLLTDKYEVIGNIYENISL